MEYAQKVIFIIITEYVPKSQLLEIPSKNQSEVITGNYGMNSNHPLQLKGSLRICDINYALMFQHFSNVTIY